LFDTTNNSQREIPFEVADAILTDMKSKYIEELNNQY